MCLISEGSCDTEDCSNDAENITGIKYIFKYIQIGKSYFKLQKNFTILQFFCIFDRINVALVRRLLSKTF